MVRRCWDTRGGTWRESCTRWEAGRSYTMEVDTSHYPYPFRAMRGTWSVADAADGGSRITMRFDYRMPWGSLGALLGQTLVARKFRPIAETLLDNWEARIGERARVG